jgi:membrane-associated protease RseP (regulator of RpoE activity)
MAPLATLKPGDRIVRVDGQIVSSWDDVVHHLLSGQNSAGVTIELADGRQVKLNLHPAAIEDRARAASAVLPYRGAVVDLAVGGPAGRPCRCRAGRFDRRGQRAQVSQRYDVLAIMDTSAGKRVTMTVVRGGRRLDLSMTAASEPGITLDGKQGQVGRIGIRFRDPEVTEPYTLFGAVRAGTDATLNSMTFIVRTVQGC